MTTSNILATKDSWISVDNPTVNNGSDTSLRVSTRYANVSPNIYGATAPMLNGVATMSGADATNASNSSTGTIPCEIALLGFNLDILGASVVSSAILNIYGGGSVIQSPAVQIFPITDYTWTELGVTWNNQPIHNPTIGSLNVYRKSIGTIAQTIDGSNNKWQTFDITSYVRAQNAASVEAEIMLYPNTGYDFTTNFDSRVGMNVPYITVTY